MIDERHLGEDGSSVEGFVGSCSFSHKLGGQLLCIPVNVLHHPCAPLP